MKRPQVFISYSHQDETHLEQLRIHLSALVNNEIIDLWCDHKINGGDEWEQKIQSRLASADLVVFLISANYFHSTYCMKEMKLALTRAKNEGTAILPVLLSECMVKLHPELAKYQFVPRGMTAIETMPQPSRAYHQITEAIHKVARRLVADDRIMPPPHKTVDSRPAPSPKQPRPPRQRHGKTLFALVAAGLLALTAGIPLDDPETIYYQALAAYQHNEFDNALNLLKKHSRFWQDRPYARLLQAQAELRTGNTEQAHDIYNQIIQSNPNQSPVIRNNLYLTTWKISPSPEQTKKTQKDLEELLQFSGQPFPLAGIEWLRLDLRRAGIKDWSKFNNVMNTVLKMLSNAETLNMDWNRNFWEFDTQDGSSRTLSYQYDSNDLDERICYALRLRELSLILQNTQTLNDIPATCRNSMKVATVLQSDINETIQSNPDQISLLLQQSDLLNLAAIPVAHHPNQTQPR